MDKKFIVKMGLTGAICGVVSEFVLRKLDKSDRKDDLSTVERTVFDALKGGYLGACAGIFYEKGAMDAYAGKR